MVRSAEEMDAAITHIQEALKELVDKKPVARIDTLEKLVQQLVDARILGRIEDQDKKLLEAATFTEKLKTDQDALRDQLTKHVEPAVEQTKILQEQIKTTAE